ncbi:MULTISPECIES: hypothetical protein [unclassified Imperialibacter]|uniref:hypothetical protein n=1 Tax=unclassified Imperialibacter TaxID=2629706 RepID=UPI00125942CD|nr:MULTISPECIES: hypothetical protein [unclassified Imperialibacter]CAD5246124.1 conserved hypothetical protein [Imperialibacter sp. 75]CAD5246146.1 conserved hypothetical protein [Imperialibacter sp. 89]VVS95987.1 conserved hypothetical protein [Imperialibacter sp. EC-SDR9]
MERFNLTYQASIFVNVSEITPKPDVLTYFIGAFADKELIPATFQEIGPAGILERFNLNDSKGIWSVGFSSNRIDIIKSNPNLGVTEIGSIEEFRDEVKKIAGIIFTKYPRNANRLAFVTTHIVNKLSQHEFTVIFNNLFKPMPTYKNNDRTEWGSRMVSRINREFNSRIEVHNVITEINRIKGSLNIESSIRNIERLQIKLDINTFQDNTDFRFEQPDIEAFYDEVVKWEQSLRDELEYLF